MDICPYCSQDSAGNHSLNCPNNVNRVTGAGSPLWALSEALSPALEAGDASIQLIRDYLELLGAYGMTLDLLEDDDGDQFDRNQLVMACSFIKRTLEKKIKEMADEERKSDG